MSFTKKSGIQHSVEKCLFVGILLLFVTPAILSLSLKLQPGFLPNAPWLRNATLTGVVVKPTPVPASWETLSNGQYQKSLADRFNNSFAGRELLIRLTSESWYRLFRQSPLASGIVLGKDDSLFTDYHLSKFCLMRTTSAQLEPIVQKMRRLQDACDKVGIPFTVLITPSKASILPENIPSSWLRRYDPRPTPYELFIELLRKDNVRFVDGRAKTIEAKAHQSTPIFPKGGIHWGDHAALATAQALIASFHARGLPLSPLEHEPPAISNLPTGEDADLVDLMNLVLPWRYPVTKLRIKPTRKMPDNPGFSLTFIGGSFTTALANQLGASGQFPEVTSFFYYKQDKRFFKDGNLITIKSPVDQVDFDSEIFSSDFLVLEVNEAFLDFTDRRYAKVFIDDALKHLEAGDPDRISLLRENKRRLSYRPGQVISFRADDHAFRKARQSLSGFSDFEPAATWTVGPTAIVQFSMPSPRFDLRLDAKVGAFIHPPQLTSQTVNVYANNQWIGEWTFESPEETEKFAHLPKDLIGGEGQITLRFEVANPTSPASLDLGQDARSLGIWVSQLKLTEMPGIKE